MQCPLKGLYLNSWQTDEQIHKRYSLLLFDVAKCELHALTVFGQLLQQSTNQSRPSCLMAVKNAM